MASSSSSSSSPWITSTGTGTGTSNTATTPIYEESEYINSNDNDNDLDSPIYTHTLASVRRAHTTTASSSSSASASGFSRSRYHPPPNAAPSSSRLYRITSGAISPSPGSPSATSDAVFNGSGSGSASSHHSTSPNYSLRSPGYEYAAARSPISSSTAGSAIASRRGAASSSNTDTASSTAPSHPSNAGTRTGSEQREPRVGGGGGVGEEDDDEEEEDAYYTSVAGLSRHSSMPISRAFRRSNNPGAPWSREQQQYYNNGTQMDSAAPARGGNPAGNRLRSNSATAEKRLSDSSVPISPVEEVFSATIPSHPTVSSPRINSGFVVTSRPPVSRTSAGHPSGGLAKTWSTAGWTSDSPVLPNVVMTPGSSTAHSRQVSEATTVTPGALKGTPITHAHAHESNVNDNSSSSKTSTPSPASPIDPSILGQANPWSPTEEERQHFRTHSSHLAQYQHSNPIDESLSPRRSNSINAATSSARQARSPVPHHHQHQQQQPTSRKSTPLLPPLVTAPDALYQGATQNGDFGTDGSATPQHYPGGAGAASSAPTSKILRGPQSAAPYVPPIGHTHSSSQTIRNGSAGSPPSSTQHQPSMVSSGPQSQQPQQPHHAPPSRAPQAGRNIMTAGPGLPQALFSDDKAKIAGNASATEHSSHVNGQSLHQQQRRSEGQQDHAAAVSGISNAGALMSAMPQSAYPLAFPSLNNPASAAAFSNNLILQQQLIAQQTQQLQEQQAQLAAALASGLSLQDNVLQHQQPGSLMTNDPYAIAQRIEALQKANATLTSPSNPMHNPSSQNHPNVSPNPGLSNVAGNFATVTPPMPNHAQLAPMPAMLHPQQSLPPHSQGLNKHSQEVLALMAEKGYNPVNFDIHPPQARFFVIKSFTEDDVFKSIKHEIWSSTALGNNRLDKAFKEFDGRGPVYLFFSVNASGHFCGVAEMLTPLDYSVSSNVWAQNDKWKGVMKLRWIYIKDIPNPQLRHLRLTNTNEQKPVTSSRDTQEVPYEVGLEMLRIFHTYQAKTMLLQDYAYYQSQTEQGSTGNGASPIPPSAASPALLPAATLSASSAGLARPSSVNGTRGQAPRTSYPQMQYHHTNQPPVYLEHPNPPYQYTHPYNVPHYSQNNQHRASPHTNRL